jgi:hypothetical protein
MLFFTFLLSLCYGGIWISAGLLVRNHFETVISMLFRKPIPDGLANSDDYLKAKAIINILGLLFIIIGVIIMIVGLFSLVGFPRSNINFNF